MFMPVESTQEIYKKPHLSFTDSAVIAIVSQLNAHPHFPQGVSRCCIHRVHRVATATFWRTFHYDGKISPGWWGGGGLHAHPLSLFQPSRTKLWCTLQLREQILRYTHPISTLPLYVLCGCIILCEHKFQNWNRKAL